MKLGLHLLTIFLALFSPASGQSADRKPNVLFIAIDDQNDWIGALGGHPLVKTPNIDRLAARGTVFLNAHCQAPLCNPSRTSVLIGLRPSTTGIYALSPWFRTVPALQNRVSLPQYFKTNGYRTAAAGKVYHSSGAAMKTLEGQEPEFEKWGPGSGPGVTPGRRLIEPVKGTTYGAMDWGNFPHNDEETADYKVASWAIDEMKASTDSRPFFIATGFFFPHVPHYATQKWFDLYPDDDSVLPAVKDGARDSLPRFSWYLHWRLPEPRIEWVKTNAQWRNLVRSYLACVSFTDSQVGRLLEALEREGLADNTIVVLWGDNGYHLGEKEIIGKNTLWERSNRVPLVFAGPGIAKNGRCTQPAELLDIYPTLTDLCGLPPRSDLEGVSLAAQLRNPGTQRERPAITTANQSNHAVRSERWRFIQYADGSEELYDMKLDPHEWNNLAGDPGKNAILEEHRRWLPSSNAAPAPGSAGRVLTYDKSTDTATWENKTKISRSDPIPEFNP